MEISSSDTQGCVASGITPGYPRMRKYIARSPCTNADYRLAEF